VNPPICSRKGNAVPIGPAVSIESAESDANNTRTRWAINKRVLRQFHLVALNIVFQTQFLGVGSIEIEQAWEIGCAMSSTARRAKEFPQK